MARGKKKVEDQTVSAETIEEIHSASLNYANGIGIVPVLAGTSESQLKAGVDKHARRIAGGEYGLDNVLLEELYTGLALASSDPESARGHIVNAAAIAAVIVDSIDAQLLSDLADHNEAVEELEYEEIVANLDEEIINDPTAELVEAPSFDDENDTAPVDLTEEELAAAEAAFSDLAE